MTKKNKKQKQRKKKKKKKTKKKKKKKKNATYDTTDTNKEELKQTNRLEKKNYNKGTALKQSEGKLKNARGRRVNQFNSRKTSLLILMQLQNCKYMFGLHNDPLLHL